LKEKRCKNDGCGVRFTPSRPLQAVCSPACAIAFSRASSAASIAKVQRKETRERKKALMTKTELLKIAQAAFNRYIRLRDAALPCISCGRYHKGSYDAGHYRGVGACPALRFEPLNCHRQCVPCNQHKSGNVIEYRLRLIQKIGEEKVGWLEGPHDPKHYGREEIIDITKKYKAMAKEMERAAA
jgi:hypothetical protein